MTAMTVEDLLLGAVDVLAEHGWRQGGFGDAARGFCVIGAISEASERGNWPVRMEAWDRLGKVVGTPHVPSWNDTPGRCYEDVVLALKKAAVLEDDS